MLASIRFGYLIFLHFKQHIGPQSVSCQIEEENKNKRFTYEMDILMSSYQQRRSPHSFQWWASTRILFRSTKQPLMTSVETTGSCFVAALFQRIVDNSYPHAHFWLPFSDPFCNILHETGRPAGPCKYTSTQHTFKMARYESCQHRVACLFQVGYGSVQTAAQSSIVAAMTGGSRPCVTQNGRVERRTAVFRYILTYKIYMGLILYDY